jgi:predicted ribosome quality control (RQC) complex YloA/Tae2 family protein
MKQLIKHILIEQTGGNYKVDEFPFGDFIVFVGKNAESNEYLTFELSDEMDLWFHAKDYPGSHVVLSLNGLYPTDDAITFSASLAKNYSKGKDKEIIEVVFCRVGEIYKTDDMGLGQVDVHPSKLRQIKV